MKHHWKCAITALSIACLICPLAIASEYVDESELFEDDGFEQPIKSIADPLKGLNKVIFNFNDFVYLKLLKPISQGYQKVVPDPAERGLVNFFDNASYPMRLSGDLLQFRGKSAMQETGKFLVNTTAGFGGFMAPSKTMDGLNPSKEDVGQAFGAWGINHGFYIVMPFLGPTSLRDGIGSFGERFVNPIPEPWTQVDDDLTRISLQATDILADSPDLLSAYSSLKDSAIDPYEAMKDAYFQLRQKEVEK